MNSPLTDDRVFGLKGKFRNVSGQLNSGSNENYVALKLMTYAITQLWQNFQLVFSILIILLLSKFLKISPY